MTLVVTALVYLLWQCQWRQLWSLRLWGAVVVALLCITPVLYWNVTHDWISFAYQLGHGMPQRDWELARMARAQAGQLLAYAPGIFLFGMVALIASRREWQHPGVRLLLSLLLPVLLLFGWSSGFEETLPHWTLLAWAALAPLIARWLMCHWQRRWVLYSPYFSLVYSLLLSLFIHSQFPFSWMPFEPYKHPLRDLHGWREASQHAMSLRTSEQEPLMVGNWTLASRIGWYARPVAVKVTDTRFDQFDLWYGTPQQGDGGVLIVPDYLAGRDRDNGRARFEQCSLIDEHDFLLGDTPVHKFSYFRCSGFHG